MGKNPIKSSTYIHYHKKDSHKTSHCNQIQIKLEANIFSMFIQIIFQIGTENTNTIHLIVNLCQPKQKTAHITHNTSDSTTIRAPAAFSGWRHSCNLLFCSKKYLIPSNYSEENTKAVVKQWKYSSAGFIEWYIKSL